MDIRKTIKHGLVGLTLATLASAPIVGVVGAFMAREANHVNYARITEAVTEAECELDDRCSVVIEQIEFRDNVYFVETERDNYQVHVEPDKSEAFPFWFFIFFNYCFVSWFSA